MKTAGLTKREKDVFLQLLEDGRMSDQEIARKIGTSRPSVARIRQKLESKGYIKSYLARPSFDKMGLKVISIIFFRWKDFSKTEDLDKVSEHINKLPEVTSLFRGEGLGGKTHAIVSTHISLEEHQQFLNNLRNQWKDGVEDVEVFLTSTSTPYKRYDIQGSIKKELMK